MSVRTTFPASLKDQANSKRLQGWELLPGSTLFPDLASSRASQNPLGSASFQESTLFPGTALLPDLEPFPDSPWSPASFQASPSSLDLAKELRAPVQPPGSAKRPVPVRPQVSGSLRAEAELAPSEEHRY